MSEEQAYSVNHGRGALVLGPAIILLDFGADIHMPWWLMLLISVTVVAFFHRPLLALREDRFALVRTFALGTTALGVWQLATWLGENGAEGLHRGWRWWLMALIVAAAIEAVGTPSEERNL